MNVRFVSTVEPPPPGFVVSRLSKRILLGGPVVVLVRDVDEVFAIVPDGRDRIEGVLVTFGSEFAQVRLGELVWHVTVPSGWATHMRDVLAGMLPLVALATSYREQLVELTRLTERMQHDLQISRDDYQRISTKLLEDLERSKAIAAENARLYREAQAALRSRDEFLSVASHELKTPLTPMKLQIQAVRRQIDKWNDGRLSSLVAKAERHVDRLALLVENLLDVSRIGRGKLEMHPERIDLVQIVGSVLDQFQSEIERTHCTVALHADAPAFGVWDPFRLEQVVVNLLSNALKFGAGRPVDIRVERFEGRVHLSVHDHGIGIPTADQARLFQRYERAVSAQQFGGLGLGLYITREIVEAHGGSVSLTSTPGLGTVVFVDLPGLPEETDQPAPT